MIATLQDKLIPGLRAAVECETARTVRSLAGCIPATLGEATFPRDLGDALGRADEYKRKSLQDHQQFLGFNGQFIKASIFLHLMKQLKCDCFVETGTRCGFSCLLVLGQTQLEVKSCDVDGLRCQAARTLLSPFGRRASIVHESGKSFIESILRDPSVTTPFFYLDAHEPSLSLVDDVARIVQCRRLDTYIIAIDDFRVPGDDGFAYDSFEGRSVACETFANVAGLAGRPLTWWVPGYQSSLESGYTAGFGLVTPEEVTTNVARSIPGWLLRSPAVAGHGEKAARDTRNNVMTLSGRE